VQLVVLDDFCSDLLGEHVAGLGPSSYCFRIVTERGYQTFGPAATLEACAAMTRGNAFHRRFTDWL
jgi:hypothetical protein